MLRILLNIGVGLSVLLGGGVGASEAVRSDGAFQGFLQQTRQMQASQVSVRAEERMQIPTATPAADNGALLQTRDRIQDQQGDQLRTATRDQLHQQDQSRVQDRIHTLTPADSGPVTPAGESWHQP